MNLPPLTSFEKYVTRAFYFVCVYSYIITAIAVMQLWGINGLALHVVSAIAIFYFIKNKKYESTKIHR